MNAPDQDLEANGVVPLWHTAGVSGDWALLNYYWLNRRREIFIRDEDGVSYFYARPRAEVT